MSLLGQQSFAVNPDILKKSAPPLSDSFEVAAVRRLSDCTFQVKYSQTGLILGGTNESLELTRIDHEPGCIQPRRFGFERIEIIESPYTTARRCHCISGSIWNTYQQLVLVKRMQADPLLDGET